MSAAVEVFQFPATGQPVRARLDGDVPWIVGRDAAVILGHSNPQKAVRDHVPAAHRRVNESFTPSHQGLDPQTVLISEAGLYRLIMRSNTLMAEQFQEWVTAEVLPAIRRTGRYELVPIAPVIPTTFAEALRLAADQHERAEREAAKVAELAPRAAQADQHRAADGCILVGDFANKLKAWAKREHGVRVLHVDVWDFLGDIGLIIRGNTVRRNHPTAFAVERDFVRLKETEYETNHGTGASTSPRLTPAGEGWAWDRAVRRIADHGSLKSTTAIERST
jgi:prophage antirepressor-like protein